MKRQTGYKLFLLLLMAILLTAGAAVYSFFSLQQLTKTIDTLSKPDPLRAQIDSMLYEIDVAETNMRFFALTNNDEYLEAFNNLSAKLNKDTASLRKAASFLPSGKIRVDELSRLLKEKMDMHANLISIGYKDVLESTLGEIDSTKTHVQSIPDTLVEERKKFFERIFGSSKNRKQELSDSLNQQKQAMASLQQQLSFTGQQGKKELEELENKELQYLKQNELLSGRIRNILLSLQSEAVFIAHEQADQAKIKSKTTSNRLQGLALAGTILIMLLVYGIYRDLNKARRARIELERARNRAEKLAADRELFLTDISHELRTPLSAIFGLSDLLKQAANDARKSEYIDAIHHSSVHLLSLVNDLLDDAHISTGNFKLESKPFSPASVMKEVVEILQPKAHDKKLSILLQAMETNDVVLLGDSMRLKQILFNLAGNAIKYTNKGSVTISAKTSVQEKGKIILHIQVSDTGEGMEKELMDRLFGRFEKGEESIFNRDSSGLGLYITKRLVKLQGGEIIVSSEKNKGTVVEVKIPYMLSHEKAEVEKPSLLNTTFMDGFNVLLAEDDEWNREIASMILRKAGAKITVAENGREAIEQLNTTKFSIAFIDLQMPEMDGMEVVKQLRSSPDCVNKTIPVFALTADRIRHNNKAQLIQLGFQGSLLKPLQWSDLSETVNNVRTEIPDWSPAPVTVHTPVYSLEYMRRITNNDARALQHFIDLFISNASKHIQRLDKVVEHRNWQEAAEIAHKLIPSGRQFYAQEFLTVLEEIEKWKENLPTDADAEIKCRVLSQRAERLFVSLTNFNPLDNL